MPLEHLIYVSSATHEMDTPALDAILAAAHRNNPPKGLTGMLLYARGSFLQILEGEPAAIDETFARISRDPRHRGLIEIERAPIEARSFAKWSMGFRRLGEAETTTHPGFAPVFTQGLDAGPLGIRPGLALDLLRSFAEDAR